MHVPSRPSPSLLPGASDPTAKMAPCPDRLRSLADDLAAAGSPEMAAFVRRVAAEVEVK